MKLLLTPVWEERPADNTSARLLEPESEECQGADGLYEVMKLYNKSSRLNSKTEEV